MNQYLVGVLSLALMVPTLAKADGKVDFPTLSVTGNGETFINPDRAMIRLGAVAQKPDAAAAQDQVNGVVEKVTGAVKDAGVAAEAIQTATVSLEPVYSDQRPPRNGEEAPEPKIIAYRASTTIRVRIDDLKLVGPVIDAAMKAGANRVEGLEWQLKDDGAARSTAMALAAAQAKSKAEVLAKALEVPLGDIYEAVENGVNIYPVQAPMMAMRAMNGMNATPVSPGQIHVQAAVSLRYYLGNAKH